MKWLKDNWILVALLGALALLGLKYHFDSSLYDKLTKEYQAQEEAYKKDIEKLQKINNEYNEKLLKINREHEIRIKKIEEDYNKKLDELSKKRKIIKHKIINDAKKNPSTLTDEVTRVFGIPVYEAGQKQ